MKARNFELGTIFVKISAYHTSHAQVYSTLGHLLECLSTTWLHNKRLLRQGILQEVEELFI